MAKGDDRTRWVFSVDPATAKVERKAKTAVLSESAQGAAPAPDPFHDEDRDLPVFNNDRFEVLGRLGSGGMGAVFKARDRALEEIVALKIVPSSGPNGVRWVERLKQEVRLARRIAHPRVCRIHDLVELGDDQWGLTMELVDGTPLSQLMAAGLPPDYRRFARWGADVADALSAAHALSIVHRDLKPENIMIRQDDRAVVLDFGIAFSSTLTPEEARLTQNGTIMGTPLYMSPEQLSNAELDGRSDLYALGLILAELITGEVPLTGESYSQILDQRVVREASYRITADRADVPKLLATSIDELLAQAADDRPDSAESVRERLRAFAAADAHRADAPAVPGAQTPGVGPGSRASSWAWLVAGAVVLAATTAAAAWLLRGSTALAPMNGPAAILEAGDAGPVAQTPADAGHRSPADAGPRPKPDAGARKRRPALPPPEEM